LFDRNQLFAGLCVVGFVNGNLFRVVKQVTDHGLASELMNTFGISLIVWVALVVGVVLLCRPPTARSERLDGVLTVAAGVAFLVPLAPLSWLAVSGLAARVIWTSQPGSLPHRGGWILLATTFPMFWSRALFAVLSQQILEFDAMLVAWITGVERAGNSVAFADGSGYLWIAPACSSFANVSLVVLCWVLITQFVHRRTSLGSARWILAASAAVIAINVTRLSLIDRYSQAFDLLHGPIGATVANWLTFTAIVGICALGVRHDLTAYWRDLPCGPIDLKSSLENTR
jgi:hypothetical protein